MQFTRLTRSKRPFLARLILFLLFWRLGGFGFFWQCKLLLLCDLWGDLWALLLGSMHFSSMKNIHLDIFGIVPPISTSSANGDIDLHLSPFILND